MNINEAIYTRRSVREFTDQPVDKATIQDLIQAAVQAPSAVNHQPWAFVVIQDKSLLRSYSDRAKALLAKSVDIKLIAFELEETLADREFNIFYNAGTLIIICAKPIGQHPDWDCCLAAQNLMLAAHGLGLGTCPIGFAWPLMAQPDVKEHLKIAPEYQPILPIVVGHPSAAAPSVPRSAPEILYWK